MAIVSRHALIMEIQAAIATIISHQWDGECFCSLCLDANASISELPSALEFSASQIIDAGRKEKLANAKESTDPWTQSALRKAGHAEA